MARRYIYNEGAFPPDDAVKGDVLILEVESVPEKDKDGPVKVIYKRIPAEKDAIALAQIADLQKVVDALPTEYVPKTVVDDIKALSVHIASQVVRPLKQKTEYLNGIVSKIIDGDTIDIIQPSQETLRVRLACIDAPERGQKPYGAAAAKALGDMIFSKAVRVESVSRDRHGRSIGKVFLPGQKFVNLNLVASGNAVVYRAYLKPCPEYEQDLLNTESKAKSFRVGIWEQKNPIMPWDWRRGIR